MSTHMGNRDTLTVVVVDEDGRPTEGARVSITPSDKTAETNQAGEVRFEIGDATRYDITATHGRSTVTVPYYVTESGATRMVVNPVYVEAREQELNPSSWYDMGLLPTIGIGLAVVLVLVILWKIFHRRRRHDD